MVQNNVFINKGGQYNLYPNIYVMLIAKSGMRKGHPVSIAKRIVESTKTTRVVGGRNSIQGIVKEMANSSTAEGGGSILKHNNAFLCSGELSSFLISDPAAFTILTDLYDGHYNAEWKTTFKVAESESLKNPCLTLLGASNQTHLAHFMDQASVTGGFVARTILVLEERKRKINPLIDDVEVMLDYGKLASYLKVISSKKGKFRFEDSAKSEYEKWYRDFNEDVLPFIDDNTGYSERVHDTILKVAMLLSLAEDPDLIIRESNFIEAKDVCLASARHAKRILVGKGTSENAEIVQTIMAALIDAGEKGIERILLLKRNYGTFDSVQLDGVLSNLDEAKVLVMEGNGSKARYSLKKVVLEEYKRMTE